MQQTTLGCMQDNEPLWKDDENIAESVAYIKPRLQYLATLFDDSENHSTAGLTVEKNNFIDAIADRSFLLAKRLTVFARKKGMIVLLKEVDRPQRYFDNGSEAARLAHCAGVVQLANEHIAELAPFKVTVADVAALSADIEKARPLSARRNGVTAVGTQITGSLAEVLAEVQLKLEELDDEMIALVEDKPFQDTYFAARKITDRRGRGEAKKDASSEVKG